jgi:hypothetical protein
MHSAKGLKFSPNFVKMEQTFRELWRNIEYLKRTYQVHDRINFYPLLLFQEYLGAESKNVDQKLLLKKKAEWAEHINEPKTAADMYLSAGEIVKVIEIYAQQGWHEK